MEEWGFGNEQLGGIEEKVLQVSLFDLCGYRWDQGGKGWSTANGFEHVYLSGLWSVTSCLFALLLYGASSQGRE